MPVAAINSLIEGVESEVPTRAAGLNSPNEDAVVAALTRRLVAGEEVAWEEFHARYFDRLRRYLFALCRGDEQAAGEGLQAAFVKIARHVRRFDREEALWGWLAVVARSCVIDGARERLRYRALLERYAGWFGTPAMRPAECGREPLAEWLDECLGALATEDRALLVAKYEEGEATAVLAARAGCSPKAIESRLARLRRRVKDKLIDRIRHEN